MKVEHRCKTNEPKEHGRGVTSSKHFLTAIISYNTHTKNKNKNQKDESMKKEEEKDEYDKEDN
jgi:hypothetical protein